MIGINEIELQNELDKFDVYKREEDISFDNLKSNLELLSGLYDTDNSDDLININLELAEKIKIINNIHNNYKIIINATIERYAETEREIIKLFSNDNVNNSIKEIK